MEDRTENVTAQAVQITTLPIASIRRDGGTQSRVGLDAAHVDELAAVLRAGGVLPPVDVYHDGTAYWLADGFHRVEAYAAAGRDEVPATIHQGTRRVAVLHSVGANATHGLRRSNEDKRRAVGVLLHDAEWAQWSDRRIAEVCGVSDPFVGKLRAELQTVSSSSPATDTRKGADGKVRRVPAPRRYGPGLGRKPKPTKTKATDATATAPTVEATEETKEPEANDDEGGADDPMLKQMRRWEKERELNERTESDLDAIEKRWAAANGSVEVLVQIYENHARDRWVESGIDVDDPRTPGELLQARAERHLSHVELNWSVRCARFDALVQMYESHAAACRKRDEDDEDEDDEQGGAS